MDEFDVVLRARQLTSRLASDQIPVPLDAYLEEVAAVKRHDYSLAADEAGHTVSVAGKRCIVVNGNDPPERQRFTICHEIAHTILGLPSEHDPLTQAAFARRSPNEVLCDVFAAELLLPFHVFRQRVEDTEIGFTGVDDLAGRFQASRTATGSRFAAVCDRPCAFVLAHQDVVRYASLSNSLREGGAWVRPGIKIPQASLAARLRKCSGDGPIEVPASDWFDDWNCPGLLLEDARYLPRWDQTLSLLWFEDDEIPRRLDPDGGEAGEEPALRELDGILPWPGRKKRRP